jgi:hypothetical protein
MGPEVPVIVLFGLIGPMFLVGFLLYWRITHLDRHRLEEIWAAYARRRGLAFVPAEGEWPNRGAPRIEWRESDARYRIEARGAESFAWTGVVASLAVEATGVLTFRRAGPKDAGAQTGDPLLDARYTVHAEPADLVRRVLTADVKRALLGFDVGARGTLTYQHGDVRLFWAGAEENDARLDEARDVVRRVVRAFEATVEGQSAA